MAIARGGSARPRSLTTELHFEAPPAGPLWHQRTGAASWRASAAAPMRKPASFTHAAFHASHHRFANPDVIANNQSMRASAPAWPEPHRMSKTGTGKRTKPWIPLVESSSGGFGNSRSAETIDLTLSSASAKPVSKPVLKPRN